MPDEGLGFDIPVFDPFFDCSDEIGGAEEDAPAQPPCLSWMAHSNWCLPSIWMEMGQLPGFPRVLRNVLLAKPVSPAIGSEIASSVQVSVPDSDGCSDVDQLCIAALETVCASVG
jgi:hypothetical protein